MAEAISEKGVDTQRPPGSPCALSCVRDVPEGTHGMANDALRVLMSAYGPVPPAASEEADPLLLNKTGRAEQALGIVLVASGTPTRTSNSMGMR